MMAPHHSWLITGCSSGLGADIALAALKAGQSVVASARNIDKGRKAYPGIEAAGGRWLTLDVTSSNAQQIVETAVKEYRIDVIINNAGYALRGVLEDLGMDQIRAQMDTNYFGAMAATKGAIPAFRERQAGTIVMISSASGLNGTPSQSQYSASKFALEGASESFAAELAPFNIRVLLMELGSFRTPFQAAVKEVAMSVPYVGTPAHQKALKLAGGHGKQPGNPTMAAEIIVEVVTGTGRGESIRNDTLRVILGSDAVDRAEMKVTSLKNDVKVSKDLASRTDFGEDDAAS